ncbi:MAG: universal stress protein [Anaerolineales bacterium]|nr:universal stress protein [Anaerolineales bacterium]
MNAQAKKRMKILLADDGSQHAQAAVKLLQELPLPSKSRVYVLRVFPPGQTFAVGQMERSLKHTEEQLLEAGINADAELVLGYPAEKIVETAQKMKPDVTVMGAKGLRATLGILLGGVAQQVVEYACCPVLVVRAPYQGLRRVLLVTDGSLYSQRAARYLGKFPFPEGMDVRLLHVVPPLAHPYIMEPYFGGRDAYVPYYSAEEERKLMQGQEREGEALLERARNLLLKMGVESTPVLVRGDAATEIIAYSDKEDVDLIVAGSRGLSQFQGWLMGSVSRKLVHYSNCSVLIVKQPESK